MLDATLAHLTAQNYIRDEKIDWPRIVDAARGVLLERIVESEAEIDAKAMTGAEIRDAVVGSSGNDEVDAELNQRITGVLSIGANGRVQKALENGHVLCSARILRPAADGEPPVSTSVRFVSGNPDVVEQYHHAVLLRRAINMTSNTHEALEMSTRRIPLLAARRPLLLTRAQEQLALAMPLEAAS